MNDFLAQLRERIPFTLAVAATTLWLLALAVYVNAHGGLEGLQALAPLDLAILLGAGAAPLAALWLIMAVMEQRRAVNLLARRTSEMIAQNRQSLQQAESQARTLMQLQALGQRTQAMETRRLALQDMAASVAVLAERLGVMNRETANAAWARYGAGDVNVFVQAFLGFAVSHPDIGERMAEAVALDPVAGAALATFVRRYERLASSLGDDKLAAEIFDDGALGRAYRLFKGADEQAARLLSSSGDAGTPAEPSPAAPSSDLTPEDDLFMRRRFANLAEQLEAIAPGVQ